MITIDKKAYEKLITKLINTNDTQSLVQKFYYERVFYYYLLKDISNGASSPNYEILKKVARKTKVSESFIIDQAKSVNVFLAPGDNLDLSEYYKTLGVSKSATEKEVRKRWIELMKTHHPDKAGADETETAKKINEAYEVIRNSQNILEFKDADNTDIPIRVLEGAPRNNLFYIVPGAVVAIIAFVYFGNSGLFFETENEREEIAALLETPSSQVPDSVVTIADDEKELPVKEIEQQDELNTKQVLTETEKQVEAKITQVVPEGEKQEASKTSEVASETQKLEDQKSLELANKPARAEKAEETKVASSKTSETRPILEETKPELAVDNSDIAVKEEPKQYNKDIETEDIRVSDKDKKDELMSLALKTDDMKVTATKPEKSTDQDKENSAPYPGIVYIVRSGDSLWTISRKFDVTTDELLAFNTMSNDKLDIGDELLVPTKKEKVVVADVQNQTPEKYNSEQSNIKAQDKTPRTKKLRKPDESKTSKVASEPQEQVEPETAKIVSKTEKEKKRKKSLLATEIEKGEKLDSSTRKEKAAKRAPDKKSKGAQKGKKEKAASFAQKSGNTEVTARKPEKSTDQDKEKRAPDSGSIYIVKSGDSLWTISRKFDLTADELMAFNNMSGNKLDIGDELLIPIKKQGLTIAKARPSKPEVISDDIGKDIDPTKDKRVTAAPSGKEKSTLGIDKKKSEIKTAKLSKKDKNVKNTSESKPSKPLVTVRTPERKETEVVKPIARADKASLRSFVSDYVTAYKNRDIGRIKSLFGPGAKENGVEVAKVMGKYEKNFSRLNLKKYDMNVRSVELDGASGFVTGDFYITYSDSSKGEIKSSQGSITWTLAWNNNGWEIRELNYKIDSANNTDE